MSCSSDIKVLQQNLIQKYNAWISTVNNVKLSPPTATADDAIKASTELTDSIACMTEYLNNNKTNPYLNYSQLQNMYYNIIVPIRRQIEVSKNEAKTLYGVAETEDHRFEIEKQNYNATVYIYIMLTILATVLLYYVLLNIVRKYISRISI